MRATRWPMVALREVIRPLLAAYQVQPEHEYPLLGIYGFGRGVITGKATVMGSDIAAKTMFKVKKGQFIYSKLKAFEGAFAVVPPEADGRFVTSEFPTFDVVPERLNSEYLKWLFRIPANWKRLASQGVGIGARRERVHPDEILRFPVPLPPLAEQARIVARLDGAAERLERRAAAAKAVEAELDATLRAAFRRLTAGAPEVRLGDVAPLVRRPVTVEPGAVYREIGARAFGRGLFHKPDLRADDLTWQQLYAIEEGDLVFSNIKAWEGAFAVATASHHGCVGSHRYLTCVTDPARATAGFVWYYLQSPEGIAQVQTASPGSADRNRTLSTRALASIAVPLPSLDAQQTFGRLQAKATAALAAQRAATEHLDKLLPAMLHEAFGEAASAEPLAAE